MVIQAYAQTSNTEEAEAEQFYEDLHDLLALTLKKMKGQFSFQSQRKAMPRNAQTTTQLHSSHMLVK